MDRNQLSELVRSASGDFSYLYVPMQSTWNSQPPMRATFRFPKAVK
jgi:hypothetical protein